MKALFKILSALFIVFVLIIVIFVLLSTHTTEFKDLSYSKCNISVVKIFVPPQAQEITG
jgi:hypothetical protein